MKHHPKTHLNADPDELQRVARAHLLVRSQELRERLERIRADLRRETTPLPADAPDAAVERGNDATLAAIGESADVELARIDNAIRRIDADLFGICESCSGEIEPERIDAVPYATLCSDCARTR